MLKILGKATSINVRKVLWCCAELHLPFVHEQWGGGFASTQTPQYLTLNPNGLVPTILDGDFVLWESNTIIRYLANQYGDALFYPRDAKARAGVDQWLDWQATEFNNAWRYPFLSLVRKSPSHQNQDDLAAAIASCNAHLGILEHQLARSGGYVAGARFTLADIVIGLSINRWLAMPVPHPDFPAVAAYFERLKQRPGFLQHGHNGTP